MSDQEPKKIAWADPLAFLPNELPVGVVCNNRLHDLYEKIKNTRGWMFKYRVDYTKARTIALRIFATVPWGKDPVFLGGVTLTEGRDHKTCYAITSSRIKTERRAVYDISNNTKLVSVDALPRAVSLLKEVCYPETIEERINREKVVVEKLKTDKYASIYQQITRTSMDVTGWDTNKSIYSVSVDDLTNLHEHLVLDIFSDVGLTALRAKYEDAYRKHAELKELHARAKRVMNMLEKVYRVHTEGGLHIVRTMHGSVMGQPVHYKTFEEMPEAVRNGVVALRMLGEGFHEDIGVSLDNGNVFWIYGKE